MVEIPVTKQIYKLAEQKSLELGELNNSIRQGQGNLIGFIGEIITSNYLSARISNTYDYDLLKDGQKIDVKTKSCTSKPLISYDCSIAAYNIKQQCDYYVFCRVLKDCSVCWLLGYYPKEEYYKSARFCKEGEIDEKSNLGWSFKANCYNLEIGQLKNIEELV
jgi:hypothetical protein